MSPPNLSSTGAISVSTLGENGTNDGANSSVTLNAIQSPVKDPN